MIPETKVMFTQFNKYVEINNTTINSQILFTLVEGILLWHVPYQRVQCTMKTQIGLQVLFFLLTVGTILLQLLPNQPEVFLCYLQNHIFIMYSMGFEQKCTNGTTGFFVKQ